MSMKVTGSKASARAMGCCAAPTAPPTRYLGPGLGSQAPGHPPPQATPRAAPTLPFRTLRGRDSGSSRFTDEKPEVKSS